MQGLVANSTQGSPSPGSPNIPLRERLFRLQNSEKQTRMTPSMLPELSENPCSTEKTATHVSFPETSGCCLASKRTWRPRCRAEGSEPFQSLRASTGDSWENGLRSCLPFYLFPPLPTPKQMRRSKAKGKPKQMVFPFQVVSHSGSDLWAERIEDTAVHHLHVEHTWSLNERHPRLISITDVNAPHEYGRVGCPWQTHTRNSSAWRKVASYTRAKAPDLTRRPELVYALKPLFTWAKPAELLFCFT